MRTDKPLRFTGDGWILKYSTRRSMTRIMYKEINKIDEFEHDFDL